MNRVCDTGAICRHTPQCEHFCHFTNAELEPEIVRKIKPYPVIPGTLSQCRKRGRWLAVL